MSKSGNKARLLVVAVIWLVVLGLCAAAYKLLIAPRRQAEIVTQTGSDRRHEHQLRLALDSFSGYSLFRSRAFHDDLAARGIGLDLVDDRADYGRRIQALRDGDVHLAAFTIDALVKASATLGELPGTIVLVLDETTGADAMLAYRQAVPNIDSLNRSEARLVVTRDSPSETLARVVMARFRLPALAADPWIDAAGAEDVYRRFRDADPAEPRAYVLWEPYVAKALEDDRAHVLIDSSKFRGYIVDVLVAQREFLAEDEQGPRLIKQVVEAYLRANFEHQSRADGLADLVQEDARAQLDERLTDAQAGRLAESIWWKNTLENYAHFGILQGESSRGVQHLDEMIRNITDVLVKTTAIAGDPTAGEPNKLYYDRLLRDLHAEPFRPSVLAGEGSEAIRAGREAAALSEAQWDKLLPVGELGVVNIVFARGTSRLNEQGQRELTALADTLSNWPEYYLLVRGHARADGDADANRQLAEDRARAAAAFLIEQGVSANRVKHRSMPPSGAGESQSVSFVVGQLAY